MGCWWELMADQASDITVQHRLRECLESTDPRRRRRACGCRGGDGAAPPKPGPRASGHQFCVRDGAAALSTLTAAAFSAQLHSALQNA